MKISDREFCFFYNQMSLAEEFLKKELENIENLRRQLKEFYLKAESEEEKNVVFIGEHAFFDTRKNPGAAENPHPSPEGKTYILD